MCLPFTQLAWSFWLFLKIVDISTIKKTQQHISANKLAWLQLWDCNVLLMRFECRIFMAYMRVMVLLGALLQTHETIMQSIWNTLSRATSQGLQVTVAWGHGWRAPKRAATAHWLRAIKLPTNNAKYTLYTILITVEKLSGGSRQYHNSPASFAMCNERFIIKAIWLNYRVKSWAEQITL